MPPGSDSIPSCYRLHASLPTSLPQHGAQLGLEVRDSIQPYRWPLGLGSAGSKACLVRALFERYLLQISSGHHSLFFLARQRTFLCGFSLPDVHSGAGLPGPIAHTNAQPLLTHHCRSKLPDGVPKYSSNSPIIIFTSPSRQALPGPNLLDTLQSKVLVSCKQ